MIKTISIQSAGGKAFNQKYPGRLKEMASSYWSSPAGLKRRKEMREGKIKA